MITVIILFTSKVYNIHQPMFRMILVMDNSNQNLFLFILCFHNIQ